jgi:hypothetical protein
LKFLNLRHWLLSRPGNDSRRRVVIVHDVLISTVIGFVSISDDDDDDQGGISVDDDDDDLGGVSVDGLRLVELTTEQITDQSIRKPFDLADPASPEQHCSPEIWALVRWFTEINSAFWEPFNEAQAFRIMSTLIDVIKDETGWDALGPDAGQEADFKAIDRFVAAVEEDVHG